MTATATTAGELELADRRREVAVSPQAGGAGCRHRRGLALMRAPDSIIGEIEAHHAARIGAPDFARVKHNLQSISSQEPEE